jgi:hypothetical protein
MNRTARSLDTVMLGDRTALMGQLKAEGVDFRAQRPGLECGAVLIALFDVTPKTAGRRHCSRRRLLSMTLFGSPPPPAGFALGRGSHPKKL